MAIHLQRKKLARVPTLAHGGRTHRRSYQAGGIPFQQIGQVTGTGLELATIDPKTGLSTGFGAIGGGALRGAGAGAGIGALFGPPGAAIGAGIGAIAGGIAGGVRRKRAIGTLEEQERLDEEEEQRIQIEEDRLRQERDRALLAGFPTGGLGAVSFFEHGGKLPEFLFQARKKAIARREGEELRGGGLLPLERRPLLFRHGGGLTPEKSRTILREGEVRGESLTSAQRRFFGAHLKHGGTLPHVGLTSEEDKREWLVDYGNKFPEYKDDVSSAIEGGKIDEAFDHFTAVPESEESQQAINFRHGGRFTRDELPQLAHGDRFIGNGLPQLAHGHRFREELPQFAHGDRFEIPQSAHLPGEEEEEVTEFARGGKLTSASRKALSSKSFVFPGVRAFPIHDISHARNALARANQGTSVASKLGISVSAVASRVRSAVSRKFPQIEQTKRHGGLLTEPDFLSEGLTTPDIVQFRHGARLTQTHLKPRTLAHGGFVPLAGDTNLVVGDTHEQDTDGDGMTGVPLRDQQGQPFAEVEDGEVINRNKVFSDALDFKPGLTFAKEAERLGREKGKFEEDLKSVNVLAKNTARRSVQNLNADLSLLFEQQEALKSRRGISDEGTPIVRHGGRLPQLQAGANLPLEPLPPMTSHDLSLLDVPGDPVIFGNIGLMQPRPAFGPISEPTLAIPQRNTPTIPPARNGFPIGPVLGGLADIGAAALPFIGAERARQSIAAIPRIPEPRLLDAPQLPTTFNINSLASSLALITSLRLERSFPSETSSVSTLLIFAK